MTPSLLRHVRTSLRHSPAVWLTYLLTFFLVGTLMNQVGQWLQIARFTYWWQVITVYDLYMVPIALCLRRLPWWQQYLYGLWPMGILELGGYALHSSYAYPANLLDQWLDARNFTLVMTLFFAAYFPLLNQLVALLLRRPATVPGAAVTEATE